MSPFLGHQCSRSFHDKTPFPGAKAILTHCVMWWWVFFFCVLFFSETLKEGVLICLMLLVLTRHKTVLKTKLLWSSSSELSERLSSGLK